MNIKKTTKKVICTNLLLLQFLSLGVSNNVTFAGETDIPQQGNTNPTSTSLCCPFGEAKDLKEAGLMILGQGLYMGISQAISSGLVYIGKAGCNCVWDYASTNIWPSVKSYFSGNETEFKSLQESLKNLEDIQNEASSNEIYGQKTAKEEMYSAVAPILSYIDDLNNKPKSDPFFPGNVIYLLGPSGCGKTTMAKAIANAVLKDPTKTLLIINPSAISAGDTLDKQLFRTIKKKDFNNEDKIIGLFDKEQKAPILEHIDKVKQAVVIIDDYDKMKKPDSNSNGSKDGDNAVAEDHTADEILKSIADEGSYIVDGNKIDCRKVLFIITSNETLENLKQNFGKDGDIGGGIQRLKTIQFDSLDFDACKKIVNRMVCKLTKELTDTKGNYKLKAIKVDEKSIENMANDIYNDKINQGRLERKLHGNMLALFSKDIGRDSGKSFKVTYESKSGNGANLVGSFKKIMVKSK